MRAPLATERTEEMLLAGQRLQIRVLARAHDHATPLKRASSQTSQRLLVTMNEEARS